MFKKIILSLIVAVNLTMGQSQLTGRLEGQVSDAETHTPLVGVTVYLKELKTGTVTGEDGRYKIEKIPVGSYQLNFSYVGFKQHVVTDVIIRSQRITFQDAALASSEMELKDIVIRGGYFREIDAKPVSLVNFSGEEIRRAPGAGGDVSRIIYGLPSLAKGNDGKNSLIVRGGSPIENSFYLDNIEIRNINHFPEDASTGGIIGLVNVDFIKDITFHSGGFSSSYGDRLSSVMELNFREGNTQEYDSQVGLNFGGVNAQCEGPIAQGKGSFMLSATRSYLDLVMNSFAEGYPAPEYADFQGKAVYNLNAKHKLGVLDILAIDKYNIPYSKAIKKDMNQYGHINVSNNTGGLNWQYIWGKQGYSNTSISHTYTKRNLALDNSKSQKLFMVNNSLESEFRLRNLNYYKLDSHNKIDFGFEAKAGKNDFAINFGEYQNTNGTTSPAQKLSKNLNTLKAAAFITYQFTPDDRWTITPGIRADYFDYTAKMSVSPRLSIGYKLNPLTSFNLTTGIFYQNIPSLILAQNDLFKSLKTPLAYHFIAGISHLINEDIRLSLEVYDKEYRNFPVDPAQKELFVFDQIVSSGYFMGHSELLSGGKAYSRGVELMIQKKLAENIYGMASASFSSCKYQALDSKWRTRIYDNRFNFNIEGGYKPNNEWEFSLRWIYAGGAPYTPFDEGASIAANSAIYDMNRLNSSRLPDYHSLNVRCDKRFYFSRTNLVLFLSIWNVYNRQNISAYTWNEVKNKQAKDIGWDLLPIIGVEFEF